MYQVTIFHHTVSTRVLLSAEHNVHLAINYAMHEGFGIHVKEVKHSEVGTFNALEVTRREVLWDAIKRHAGVTF